MPMPSNLVRGAVIKSLAHFWNSYSGLRYVSYILVSVNFLYFAQTYKLVYYVERPAAMDRFEECDHKISLFREQRNLYITGFSIFIFFVFRRLLDIQTKLFEARRAVKESKAK